MLDVDPDHGGVESLALVERRCGLPPTLTAVSGGGGRHFYLGHPGVTIGPSAGKLGAGLDIRADRGLIVAPPSVHASGRRYSWVDSSVAPAPCPRWMIQALVARPRPRARAVKVSGDVSAFARAVLDRAAAKVRQAADGTKHDVLWRQAFHLGTFVGAGLFDAEVATDVLMAALGSRYKSEKAALATVERNIAQGKAKPAELAS